MPAIPGNSYPLPQSVPPNLPDPTAAGFLTTVLPTWTDLSQERQRDLASAMRALGAISGLPLGAIPLDCGFLRTILFGNAPRRAGKRGQRIKNIRSETRYVLGRLDRHEPALRGLDGLSPEWCHLYGTLPTGYRRAGLSRFMHFCSRSEVSPALVSSETLGDFETYLAQNALVEDPAFLARLTLGTWKWASRNLDGWPSTALKRPKMRQPYVLQLTAFPSSFQEEVAELERSMAPRNGTDIFVTQPFGTAGKRRFTRGHAARPATVASILFRIRMAASALVLKGRAVETITSLADLVDPLAAAAEIISFYWDRGGGKPSSMISGIAILLMQIARRWCQLPEEHVGQLNEWVSRAKPVQQGMVDKNRRRMQRLIEPDVMDILLNLPAELLRRARQPDLPSRIRARLALQAAVFEILLVCPMRLSNLLSLRLDLHLQRLGTGRNLITHIFLDGSEVKNGESTQWPIPTRSAQLIETYIRDFRPVLAAPGNTFLLPSRDGKTHVSAGGLRTTLASTMDREAGAEWRPHLARHTAAFFVLDDNHEAYETVRRILHHKTASTATQSYTGFEVAGSARHLDRLISRRLGGGSLRAVGVKKPTRPGRR